MKSVTLLSYLLAQHPPWCWNTLFLQCSNTDHSSFSWYLSSHSFSVSCSVSTCYISDSWSSVLSSLSCMCAQSLQSCLTLCNPMDCSLPGFFVHGIFQARKLECHFLLQEIFPTQGSNHISCVDRWIIYPLSHPGIKPPSSVLTGGLFTHWKPGSLPWLLEKWPGNILMDSSAICMALSSLVVFMWWFLFFFILYWLFSYLSFGVWIIFQPRTTAST